jgi:hypothetical protein
MSTNISDITLQSTDGVLEARNDMGNLTYPMLFLDREPEPNDAQGWDRVLVFVDGSGAVSVNPMVIHLKEENSYFQSIYLTGEGAWSISGVSTGIITLDTSSGQMLGVGNARLDVERASTLTAPGEYSTSIVVTLGNGTQVTIPVYITVSVLLTVDGVGHNSTRTITLNASNNYTQPLTIVRDREWTLENVDTNIITVTPTSGSGVTESPFATTLTVTKSPSLAAQLTAVSTDTTFYVVSLYQRVQVNVHIDIPALVITLDFVAPRPGTTEVGAPAGQDPLYLYV